jgi:hypothetical protein
MKSKVLMYLVVSLYCLSFYAIIPSWVSALPQTSQGEIFDGMYAEYDFTLTDWSNHTRFEYTHFSGDVYEVSWNFQGYGTISTWNENIKNRLISNSFGSELYFNNGSHAPLWLFTNISLGDSVLISVDGSGDQIFNVSGQKSFTFPGFGSHSLWVLQDLSYPSGIAWYDNNTGLLLNGTFIFSGGSMNYTLTLTATNMFPSSKSSKIWGYNIFIIITTVITISIILYKRKSKKK